jgi:hypothetical protein
MPSDNLIAALGDLVDELPPGTAADVRSRLTTLISALQSALSAEAHEPTVQTIAERFLGAPPAEVLRVRPEPDWRTDG